VVGVGDGNGRLIVRHRLRQDLLERQRAFQKRIGRVDPKMDELRRSRFAACSHIFGSLCHRRISPHESDDFPACAYSSPVQTSFLNVYSTQALIHIAIMSMERLATKVTMEANAAMSRMRSVMVVSFVPLCFHFVLFSCSRQQENKAGIAKRAPWLTWGQRAGALVSTDHVGGRSHR